MEEWSQKREALWQQSHALHASAAPSAKADPGVHSVLYKILVSSHQFRISFLHHNIRTYDHMLKLSNSKSGINYRKDFFTSCIINAGNLLSQHVVMVTGLENFDKGLDTFRAQIFQQWVAS